MGIGIRLSKLLEQKNISARELALKIGVTPSTVYSIIQRDSSRMDIDLLLDIAHELGMTADELLDPNENLNENSVDDRDCVLISSYHKLNQKGQDYIDDQMAFALSQSKFTEGATKKEA